MDGEWISGAVKPSEPGRYRCCYEEHPHVVNVLHWTGKQWRRGEPWNHVASFGLRAGDRWQAIAVGAK